MEKSKTLIWSTSAQSDLQKIYGYYSQFSASITNHIIDRIFDKASLLEQAGNDNIGQIDEYNSNFRRLISGNYKIFYKVFTDEILIVRIFDSRQNPTKSNIEVS